MWLLTLLLVLLSTGCVQWVERDELTEVTLSKRPELSVVMIDGLAPKDFAERLKETLEEQLATQVQVSVVRPGRDQPKPRADLIIEREYDPDDRPGWGGLVISVMTLTLYPAVYRKFHDDFRLRLYDKSGKELGNKRLRRTEWTFAFILMLPLTPFSLAWQALRGNEYSDLLDLLPSAVAALERGGF